MIEERIIEAVWDLLTRGVNFYLADLDTVVKMLDRPEPGLMGKYGLRPEVVLKTCDAEERERVLRQEVFTVAVKINAAEMDCYFYTYGIKRALDDDRTMGGVAVDVQFSRCKYDGGVEFGLRVITEQCTVNNVQ
jgi:hypothetical protein